MLAKRHLALSASVIAGILLVAVALPSVAQTPTLTVSTTALANGEQNVAYSATLTGSGGTTPYSWSIVGGSLPAGLALNASSGQISGTPTTVGTSSFTVKVTDATNATATRGLSITISSAQAPAITSATSATFTVGQAGSFTVMTTGTPTPSVAETGSLPSGVTFTDNGNGTGTLAGTPAAGTAGTYSITFTASNGIAPNATQSFTLTVAASTAPPAGAGELSSLAQAVQGVGPGRSLAAKIRVAQMAVAAGNMHAACGVLQGFINEVSAQSGKKIPSAQATQLIAEARQVESLLGC